MDDTRTVEVVPPTTPGPPPANLVAVVVPLSNRAELTKDEELSHRHLMQHLSRYDKFVVAPTGLEVDFDGFTVKRFDEKYFGSADAYKRLILSRGFYEAFENYEFIFIYHLDALVFSDELEKWCEAGYDFIGAPLLKTPDRPEDGFRLVGNGGFSLRRVSACLNVIDSSKYSVNPEQYWKRHFAGKRWYIKAVGLPRRFLKRLRMFNGARWEMSRWHENCDIFFARRATHFCEGFRIAPIEQALSFAFESAPEYCFEQNNGMLPFGCHAWTRYDRAFWEPHLLKG